MLNLLKSSTSILGIGCLAFGLAACETRASQSAENAVQPVATAQATADEGSEGINLIHSVNIAQPVGANQVADGDEDDPVICKIEEVSGSRLAKVKVCARESERDAARSRTRIGLEEFHRQSTIGPLRGG